jgi:5-methylcytosine-specific restriction endonuclease McrA
MDVGKGLKNGIDRIDSNKGYTMDNCVSCCWTCNRMKGNMTQQNFLEHISKINVFSN